MTHSLHRIVLLLLLCVYVYAYRHIHVCCGVCVCKAEDNFREILNVSHSMVGSRDQTQDIIRLTRQALLLNEPSPWPPKYNSF